MLNNKQLNRKEFERVSPEQVGIPSEAINRLLDKLESGFTEPHGLMIMRYGKVCAEGWWSPYAPGIRHGLQSHTKTYAATAVGIAYTDGLLELEDRIVDLFPDEIPSDPSANLLQMTVHDVLSMGCGMDKMPAPTENWMRDFLATPVNHVPGTRYMYNSIASTFLGAIVKKVTGQNLHEYLTKRLFDKIGIDADNIRWIHMPDGMEIGGGGMFATTEDNLRLMKLYADGGVWEGERILAEEFVRRATTKQIDSATEEKNNPDAKDNFVGYGYQIWMCRPEGVYRADGAMGQFTIVIPDKELIISITENASNAHWAQETLDVMWEFSNELPDVQVLPDNEEAKSLAKRMDRLALPHPKRYPSRGIPKQISGIQYTVEQGEVVIDYPISRYMSGSQDAMPIEAFRFDFEADECVLHFKREEEWSQITIALDGTRMRNRIISGSSPVTIALANGGWLSENSFQLTIRWVETCFEQKFDFTFENKEVILNTRGLSFFGPSEPIIVRAASHA